MAERIYMRADVIHHGKERRASAERILGRSVAPGFHLVVGELREDDRSREELVRRHVVGEQNTQIYDHARHSMYLNPLFIR
jgi:hypothetical protein